MSEIIEAKKKIIEDSFSSIVGQQAAVKACKQSLLSYIHGGELTSCVYFGQAGLGKTALMLAMQKALEGINFANLIFSCPADFRKSDSAAWIELSAAIQESSYALFLDEIHELWQPQLRTVQLTAIQSLLLRVLDGNFKGGAIQLSDTLIANFSRRNCAIIGGTNFPGRLPEAIKSRAKIINLVHYKENELVSILVTMLASSGLHVRNEEILGQIARCGRGTARPMEQITRQLRLDLDASGNDKETISQKDIFGALKALEMFPRGCAKLEMQLLDKMKTPSPSRILRANFPSMDRPTWEHSTAHLLSLSTAKGIPFLTIRRNGDYATTEAGIKFLQVSHDEGFRWAE